MNRHNGPRIICSIALLLASLMSLLSPSGVVRADTNLVLKPGADVTINGRTVSLWDNIGKGGFNWTGTPASAIYNVPR